MLSHAEYERPVTCRTGRGSLAARAALRRNCRALHPSRFWRQLGIHKLYAAQAASGRTAGACTRRSQVEQ